MTVIRNDDLKKLTRKIERLQGELDSIDNEMLQLEASKERPSLPAEPAQMTSLQQWFARYGEAGPAPPGYLTTFEKNSKIYGGTNHHKGACGVASRVGCTTVA